MADEVKLEPGWLIRDVRRASEKVSEWASKRGDRQSGGRENVDSSEEHSTRRAASDRSSD